MMENNDEIFLKILDELGVSNRRDIGVDWWRDQERSHGLPALQVALLLRQAWRTIHEPTTSAVAAALSSLERRACDDDSYQSEGLRRNPETARQISAALKDARLGPALVYLIRSVQIETVGAILQIIDGGETYESGLAGSWMLFETDENLDPKKPVGDLAHLFYKLDPVVNNSRSGMGGF